MAISRAWPFGRVNAAGSKHELTRQQLQEYLGDAGYKLARDLFAVAFGRSGIFPIGAAPQLDLQAGGNDQIDLTTGLGLLFNSNDVPPLADWTLGTVEVENLLATTYHTGLRLQRVPVNASAGVRQNLASGAVEYVAHQMAIGELGHPDSVTDNGNGTIDLDVATIVKAGGASCNHGERSIVVWLDTPVDPLHTVALQTGTVDYAAGNYDTTSSIGDLGQTARVGSVSVTPADYWVLVTGPTVTTLDISASDQYLYTGEFAGAGAVARSGVAIGAIDVSGVYRFESTIGTLAANVLQLAKDVYTIPSLDGDGLANLPVPLETLCTNAGVDITNLQLNVLGLRNILLLPGLSAVEAVGPPLRRLDNVAPIDDQIITKNMEVWWGVYALTGDEESIPGDTIDPPDNQVSLIVIRQGSPSTFEFLDIVGGTYADPEDVIVGLVAMVGHEIIMLHFFPQWSVPGRRLEGLTVQHGNTSNIYCLVQPGRFTYWRREYVNPYSVDLAHNNAALWVGGVPGGVGWVYVYSYVAIVTENRILFKLSSTAPGPDGWYPGLAAGSSDFLMRYIGAVYWTGAAYLPQWTSRDGKVLCGVTRTALTGGAAGVATLVDLSAIIPPTARAVLLHARITGATTTTQAIIGSDSLLTYNRVIEHKDNDAEVETDWVEFWLPVNTVQSIWYMINAGAGALDLLVAGYEEDREQPGLYGAPLIVT